MALKSSNIVSLPLFFGFLFLSSLPYLSGCSSVPVSAPVTQRNSILNKRSHSYKVRRGDTLFSIAWQTQNDFKRLAQWNGIRPPYTIYPGQIIKLSKKVKVKKKNYLVKKTVRYADNSSLKKKEKQRVVKNLKKTLKVRWQWPLQGSLERKFSSKEGRAGIDITARKNVIVRAAASGKVVYSGSGLIGYGNLLIIKHSDNFLSAYGFNRRLLTKEGAFVKAGERIAEAGLIGGQRKLHFEIRRKGKPVNPLHYLPPLKK